MEYFKSLPKYLPNYFSQLFQNSPYFKLLTVIEGYKFDSREKTNFRKKMNLLLVHIMLLVFCRVAQFFELGYESMKRNRYFHHFENMTHSRLSVVGWFSYFYHETVLCGTLRTTVSFTYLFFI